MAAEVDGRRARREQNRAAVLDALAGLYREGIYSPSTAQIAERAGLSSRSLFRYFDDVDDLNRAAIDQQLARARPLLQLGAEPDDPFATRVEQLVDARLRLYEAIAPAARAARVADATSRLDGLDGGIPHVLRTGETLRATTHLPRCGRSCIRGAMSRCPATAEPCPTVSAARVRRALSGFLPLLGLIGDRRVR